MYTETEEMPNGWLVSDIARYRTKPNETKRETQIVEQDDGSVLVVQMGRNPPGNLQSVELTPEVIEAVCASRMEDNQEDSP